MRATTHGAAALLFALCTVLLAAPRPAQAETLGTCVGYIDSVPATITTQGTWCMRKDLSTSIASGAAITVAANNVIIDCNDFKLGGLAAGPATQTTGILASERINVRVRNCAIRGFLRGVLLQGAGHAVVDSRFDNNVQTGIHVTGEGLEVLRNTVRDTGGSTAFVYGILAVNNGFVQDNRVFGVYGSGSHDAYGIYVSMLAGAVSGNRIANVDGAGAAGRGIWNTYLGSKIAVVDNVVTYYPPQTVGAAIDCGNGISSRNVVNGHSTGQETCYDGGGNTYLP
jgi:hypothetical protein